MDNGKQLSNYLADMHDFVNFIQGIDIEKIKQAIGILDIKFKQLDNLEDNLDLFQYVSDNNHYEINNDFIVKILKQFDDNSINMEDVTTSNYSTINQSSCTHLKSYITSNIEDYIDNVFLKIDTNIQETEKTIIDLINNDKINDDLKMRIIKKQETKISDLNSIEEQEQWYMFLEQNKILVTWDNVSLYYNYNESLEKILVQYLSIKDNALELSKTKVGKSYCEKHAKFNRQILRDIMETNIFELHIYDKLVQNIGYWYFDLDISNLDEEKIALLVKHNNFQFESICFDTLKEHTASQHIALIERNINDYLDKFDDFQIDTDDAIRLLESENIALTIKKEIIEKIDFNLINNSQIAKLIYTYVDKTIIKSINYTKAMLKHLASLESRINLVVEQEEEFNEEELLDILRLLPEKYSKVSNLDGKQTVLNRTDYNQSLISLLDTRGFITKHKLDKANGIRLYIKRT